MTYEIVIEGRLPGLNEYINAERSSKFAASCMKKNIEQMIVFSVPKAMRGMLIKHPVHIAYKWVEPDRRRDKSNIAWAKKFIEDALVKAKVLQNDGWKQITGFSDEFEIGTPMVVVRITEIKETKN